VEESISSRRVAGLMEEWHPGQQRSVRTPRLQAKVLAAIKDGPKDGSTHWSCRKLADRLDPVLPLSPGRLERHGFEYKRNGTLSLYATLDVKTGKVEGETAARRTSAEFVNFLEQIISGCDARQEIHIVLDNLSAHKTNQVGQFLERNPTSNSISRRPIPPGSIRLRFGSPDWSAK
jgi:hypothetical protein